MFEFEALTRLHREWPVILVAILFLIILLLLPFWLLRNRHHHNLQSLPGPFLYSITVLPRLWSVYQGKSHWDDLDLHKKYGAIVRVAPNLVSIADPAALDMLYGISSKCFKAGFYEPVRFHDEQGLLPDPFVLADKTMHTRMKRNAANAYSLSALVQLESMVEQVVLRLFRRFGEEYVAKDKVFDIGHYMLYFAMDTIFTVTFGKYKDLIGKGDTKHFCEHLRDGLPYIACIGQIPWAHRFLLGSPYVARFFEGGGQTLVKEVMVIAVDQRVAAEKLSTGNDDDDPSAPCTFLMRLLRNQARNPASMTEREINAHTFGNITVGELEITKLITSLVLRYDVEWAPGAADISVSNYFFTMQMGMLVSLRPRGDVRV